MSKEPTDPELIFRAMKGLWIMEGQIQTLEAYLADPPTKEASMGMLRELREKRESLERLVGEYSGVEMTKRRLGIAP